MSGFEKKLGEEELHARRIEIFQVNVGWDGTLYDCDFNLALKLPVNHIAPNYICRFDPAAIRCCRIVTGRHCLGCTAGHGSSCGGSLVQSPIDMPSPMATA